MKIKNCDYCGKEIHRKSFSQKKKHTFCSRRCFGKFFSGENNPYYTGTITKNCEFCNKTIVATPSRFKNKEKVFCSYRCRALYFVPSLNEIKLKKRIKKICLGCENEFSVPKSRENRAKFCSLNCQARFSLKKRKIWKLPKNLSKPTKPERQFMEICKKYNLPYKYVGNSKFWIEDINPDFVETNGRKIAIEIFGHYWHEPLLNKKLKWDRTVIGRQAKLKKYGWESIIFWDNEINDGTVLEKLKRW